MRFLIAVCCLLFGALDAKYLQVYNTDVNGGIAFTGNTLGLNKANDQNAPGTKGSIGVFISTDNNLTVPTWKVNNVLVRGVTLDWEQNGSTAVLDIPDDSQILHAELIWAGSYGFGSDVTQGTSGSVVTFITPGTVGNIHQISPKPLYPTGTGQFRVENSRSGFYVRSADVTTILQNLGPLASGTYAVGHVPGTVSRTENNLNCAGWTLAVAYSNHSMLTSSLNLYVACEASGAAASKVENFTAPSSPSISSRLFVSSLEGDAQLVGDSFLIGNSPSMTVAANAIQGTNNPKTNFFASQINTLLALEIDPVNGKLMAVGDATIDTRGSFGYLNSNAFANPPASLSGARQGYDITSIDIGNKISPGQTVLYAQGVTNQDVYTITGLGVQIQQMAPIIKSVKTSNVSEVTAIDDLVTFTCTFTNIGDIEALNVAFTDVLPSGLVYVANTFTVNSASQTPGYSNNTLTYNLGTLDVGVINEITVQFQAKVESINPPNEYVNSASVKYTYGDGSVTPTSQTNEVIVSTPEIVPCNIKANDDDGSVANGAIGGVAVDDVLINDTFNGSVADLASVTLDQTGASAPLLVHLSTDPNSASVIVEPGTPKGVYTVTYRIADINDPTCFSDAVVTVTVGSAEIQANPDIGTVVASPNATVAIDNVLNNDTLAGKPPTLQQVTINVETEDPNLILNTSTGQVIVKPGTPPGTYTGLTYSICEKNASPANCSTTSVTVIVTDVTTPLPPSDFNGVIRQCICGTTFTTRLFTTWSPSGSQDVVLYRIYKGNRVVAEVPATDPLVYQTCLRNKASAGRYSVSAVSSNGLESTRTRISITDHSCF